MKSSNLITFAFCMIALLSCNQQTNTTQEINNDSLLVEEKVLIIDENEKCFLATVGKDSAFLALNINDDKVKGQLNYQFFEKDNSNGTLEGTLEKDTLNLIYTFTSEGSTSTRPIKMLLRNNKIFEVYGNKIASEGKGFIYNPSECKE